MTEKIKIILSVIFTSFFLAGTGTALAANSIWNQTDWSGGADQSQSARHPDHQTGWSKYFSKDPYTDTSVPGQISLSPQPLSRTQTSDIEDFDRGTLANLVLVGTGTTTAARYEETSPSVTKTGLWRTATGPGASGGSMIYSDETGAAATVSFTGSQVSWIGVKANSYGIAAVYLDGVFQTEVDLYMFGSQTQVVLFTASGLPTTTHTLRIEVTGRRNPRSNGPRVAVDAFDIVAVFQDEGAYLTLTDDIRSWIQTGDVGDFDTGTLTNLILSGTGYSAPVRYEETSPSVTTTGLWRTATGPGASGGSMIYSDETGATATFIFTGVEVSWIGVKASNYGIAAVYLDGVFKEEVDLYMFGSQTQAVLFTASGLANTAHTLRIEVTGRRNPKSNGPRVAVDAFDIVALFPDAGASLRLTDNALSGVYESPSFDTGDFGAIFSAIAWNASVPSGSDLKFQFASNTDNQTWNFVGPDGTPNSYYVTSGTPIYAGHNQDRFIRYRAYFDRPVVAPEASPILNDVTITYGTTSGIYESPSFDAGLGGAFYSAISWTATTPPGAGVRFRFASNNDNATWNFTGPDGTPDTYYVTPGSAIYSGHDGHRYFKYQSILVRPSLDPAGNPQLHDVTLSYEKFPGVQSLISSPFDTTDATNGINRMKWSEDLPPGTDAVIQLRTSPDGNSWGSWYGPHAATFTAVMGVSQVVASDVAGFYVGGRVTLTDGVNHDLEDVRTITAINSSTRTISLDAPTTHAYSANSILTDSYTDKDGMEFIYPAHRSGSDDQWIQYRVFLFTSNGTVAPAFLENQIGYLSTNALFQPDGIIDGNGDNIYGTFGSGSGGSSSKLIDPGYRILQPPAFDVRIQNDGTPQSGDDTYTISWNTPSDALGSWTVFLNDGASDLTSPISVPFNLLEEKVYSLKVIPTLYSPGGTSRDITINLRSENDLSKTESIKATAIVRSVYQADGIIGTNGDDVYDPYRTGGGGTVSMEGSPGDITNILLRIQNEGNVSDSYTLSLTNPPPVGWTVLFNDGSKDYDITNPANSWTTPVLPARPAAGYQATYTIKVIPKGAPMTADIILNIFSNGSQSDLDSVKIQYTLKAGYKVDGIIYGFGYDQAGGMTPPGVQGSGCSSTSGDDVYGSPGSGSGGCTAVDIAGGSARVVSVGVQNEGNIADKYRISWSIPSGWTVVMQERLNNGSVIEYVASPVDIPTATAGNPAMYNPGEMPFVRFIITPPQGFTSGSETVTIDILSLGDSTKSDSVKAVINSGDTTPPAASSLFVGSATATSVTVSWTAPGDDGSNGTASSYDLRYATSPITSGNFDSATKVRSCKTGGSDLARPKPSGDPETCVVQQLYAGTTYYFALKTFDEAGNASPLSSCLSCPVQTSPSNDTTRPGQIADLAVVSATKDTMTLCWTAPADNGTDQMSGPATEYEIRYSKRRIVDDGVTPGVGESVFSSALPAAVIEGLAPPKPVGTRECYLVTVTNDIDTGGGIIDPRVWNTRFYFAMKTIDEARNKSLLSNVAGGLTVLRPYAYNTVSVPYAPNPSSPQDVFGDDVGASQLKVYWWDSRGPNPDSGCYDGEPEPYSSDPNRYTCTRLTTIREGNGYFLWVPPGSASLDVPSSSTVSPVQNCVDDVGVSFQCYVFPLQEGWNMFGTPFDTEINFTSRDISGNIERGLYVRGTRGSTVKVATFQNAVTAERWVDGSIYMYNGSNYTYEVCDQDGTGEPLGTRCSVVMQPWKAYWVRTLGSARFDTFELLIPY